MPIPNDEHNDDVSSEMEEMAKLINRAEPKPEADEDKDPDEFVVGAKKEEEDDDEGKSRREKRRERKFSQNKQLADENESLKERLARLEGYAQSINPVALQQALLGRQQPQEDPADREMEELKKQRKMLFQSYAAQQGKMTPEQEDAYQRQADELEEKRIRLLVQRSGGGRQPDDGQRFAQIVQMQNRARHPDVYGNQQMVRWAGGRFSQLQAEKTDANGNLTVDPQLLHDQVMEETRSRFNLPSRNQRDDQSSRRRHTARGTGASARSGTRKTFRMTKEYKDMADELYPEVKNDRERYQKWVDNVGKGLG